MISSPRERPETWTYVLHQTGEYPVLQRAAYSRYIYIYLFLWFCFALKENIKRFGIHGWYCKVQPLSSDQVCTRSLKSVQIPLFGEVTTTSLGSLSILHHSCKYHTSLCPLQKLDAGVTFISLLFLLENLTLAIRCGHIWLIKYSQFILLFSQPKTQQNKVINPRLFNSTLTIFILFWSQQNLCIHKSFITQYQGWPLCIQRAQHFSQAYWWIVFLLSHAHFYLISDSQIGDLFFHK